MELLGIPNKADEMLALVTTGDYLYTGKFVTVLRASTLFSSENSLGLNHVKLKGAT